jgi:WD40 repeat protein
MPPKTSAPGLSVTSRRRRSPSLEPSSASHSSSAVTRERRGAGGKRRVVGDRESESLSPSAIAATSFRLLEYARQTQAACLMFCHENLCATLSQRHEVGDGVLSLSALPSELVLLVALSLVAGNAVVRFTNPELEFVEALKGSRASISVLASLTLANGTQLLASGGDYENAIKLWDCATRECVATLVGPKDNTYFTSLAHFPDDEGVCWLASGSGDGSIVLWDAACRSQHTRKCFSRVRECKRTPVLGDCWTFEQG